MVVGMALVTANLPFLVQRPFLILPWAQSGEPARPAFAEFILSLLFLALLGGLGYYAFVRVGQAFFVSSDAASTGLFLLTLVGSVVVIGALLAFPGWRNRSHSVVKSFFARLLELLVFYALTGALGFALELNMGNMFSQRWEFYAITFSLFVVLGYPGFVYRYLMRHPKPPRKPKSADQTKAALA